MKMIDILKLDKIKERHFEYCKSLRPQNGKKFRDENIIYQLCCENPFDFTNSSIPLKQDYIKFLYSIIDYSGAYENFRRREDWGGVELLKVLEVDICPYCGINYFSTVSKEKQKEIAVATFDHYLPQSKYKFLALNLYNLIPCCKNCNSTFKRADETPVLNPFFHSIEDEIDFRIKENSILDELINNKSEINIEIKYDATNNLAKQHKEILFLEERYNYFRNIAKSIIYKRQKYNKEYLKSIKDLDIGLSEEQMENLLISQDIFGDSEPFQKFKKDIWMQLNSYL